jgi:hypothetical protein
LQIVSTLEEKDHAIYGTSLARRHREVLAKLDPVAGARYQITEKDIRTIERYLKIIQASLESEGVSLWQEIVALPTGYATSLVIHELIEIRILQATGVDPLKLRTRALQRTLASHIEAHIQATYAEHVYLQEYIAQHYQQAFQVGTLLKVNRDDELEEDLQLLIASHVGVVIVEEDKLTAAWQIMAELKGETL